MTSLSHQTSKQGLPLLRPYQAEAGRAILASVLGRRGLTFSVMMARQGGKNELSAQLELLLLVRHALRGGNGVKAAPTFRPQLLTSLRRLQDRLDDAGLRGHWETEQGAAVRLGRARWLFYSAEPHSHVVGATAHLLLEIDEAQDVDTEKYEKEFRPMGAATGVTTVLYGTAWDDAGLLERAKALHVELERRDGLRRHFEYDWQVVADHNPAYRGYVEAERERLGEGHPLFQTQYCLRPVSGQGRFLNPQQLALLEGDHPRCHAPRALRPFDSAQGGQAQGERVYVAGVDMAGEAEEGEGSFLRAHKPRQDSTVVTIGEADFSDTSAWQPWPLVRVVEHYWWTGVPHANLAPQLLAVLKEQWRCQRVAIDATGVGEGVASLLKAALGERVVRPLRFTAPVKSQLGFDLLAAANSGRLRLYADDGSLEARQCRWELAHARSFYRPNQTLAFGVDPSEGHDDFLMSLALVLAAATGAAPRRARGRVGSP